MFFMQKMHRRGTWILGLGLAFSQAAQAVNGCSAAVAASAQIEVLPVTSALTLRGQLQLSGSSQEYKRPFFSLQSVTYDGDFIIYKVWLHEGNNNIAFRLDPDAPADLVLAMVKSCNDLTTCVANSPEVIGTGSEIISPRAYSPGTYYLFVDSRKDVSGSYT